MFVSQWQGLVDGVVVVDNHITVVVSEHQAGKVLNWPDTAIRIKGRARLRGGTIRSRHRGCGGITLMVNVLDAPDGAFGYAPIPALVAPLEFTLCREALQALGRHDSLVRDVADTSSEGWRLRAQYPRRAAEEPDMNGALTRAARRFDTLLQELVVELPRLRQQHGPTPKGAVAHAMVNAADPVHGNGGHVLRRHHART